MCARVRFRVYVCVRERERERERTQRYIYISLVPFVMYDRDSVQMMETQGVTFVTYSCNYDVINVMMM